MLLNRRHIRIKVMQSIYAMHTHETDSLDKTEKFLYQSIENMHELYLLLLSALVELRKKEEEYLNLLGKKRLATEAERNPNRKFVDNAILQMLATSDFLNNALEDNKITNWTRNDDVVLFLLEAVKKSGLYADYMQKPKGSFETESAFIADLYTEIIAPNERLYDYLEDYKLTWLDDLPLVNTLILGQIKDLQSDNDRFRVAKLYKNEDDKVFVKDLFRKTVLNEVEFAKEYSEKTPNWDKERIAEIDNIILKMAICELQKFPSIPVKVTMNEYLEIAKDYSTPNSSIFINGILDNLVKEYSENGKMKKIGRGLL